MSVCDYLCGQIHGDDFLYTAKYTGIPLILAERKCSLKLLMLDNTELAIIMYATVQYTSKANGGTPVSQL